MEHKKSVIYDATAEIMNRFLEECIMAKPISHYHILIIESSAHAHVLPLIRDKEWMLSLLHADEDESYKKIEKLVSVASAKLNFEEIIQDLDVHMDQFKKSHKEFAKEKIYHAGIKLALDIKALRLDFYHPTVAHEALMFLSLRHIQTITNPDDTGSSTSERPKGQGSLPSPGYSFSDYSPLHILPFE